MIGSAKTVRNVSVVEGISLLLLLFVAMPLKYGLGYEVAVQIVGSLHGALFVGLVLVCAVSLLTRSLPLWVLVLVGLLSVVPFGFLIADRLVTRAAEPSDQPQG